MPVLEPTAKSVAEFLIWSAHESGSFISNLKLQKLLYYIQAWHLAIHDRPLFAAIREQYVTERKYNRSITYCSRIAPQQWAIVNREVPCLNVVEQFLQLRC